MDRFSVVFLQQAEKSASVAFLAGSTRAAQLLVQSCIKADSILGQSSSQEIQKLITLPLQLPAIIK